MAAASFTEGFDFRTLDRLDEQASERALAEPALPLGVTWDPSAASAALTAAGGRRTCSNVSVTRRGCWRTPGQAMRSRWYTARPRSPGRVPGHGE